MRNKNISVVVSLIAGLTALTTATLAWSDATVPAENKLDPSYYDITHSPRIDFTEVDLFYVHDKGDRWTKHGIRRINRKWGKLANSHLGGPPGTGNFVAKSGRRSTFTMVDPDLGETSFNGYFYLTANINEAGALQGGSYSFISNDDMFGFGTETVCRRNNKCKEKNVIGEVFGGTLNELGWSESENFIEFATGSFTGWACDMGWCTQSERLWFNVSGDSIGFTQDSFIWGEEADGVAVIPVPAAAWLFGSGLLALVGFSRKNRAS